MKEFYKEFPFQWNQAGAAAARAESQILVAHYSKEVKLQIYKRINISMFCCYKLFHSWTTSQNTSHTPTHIPPFEVGPLPPGLQENKLSKNYVKTQKHSYVYECVYTHFNVKFTAVLVKWDLFTVLPLSTQVNAGCSEHEDNVTEI